MHKPKYLKTSQYAHMFNQKRPTVTIYLDNPNYKKNNNKNRVILYARVSSRNNLPSLDGQIQRMRDYSAAKGYIVVDEVKEIASGLNDRRPKLRKIFKRDDYGILLSEHRDRLTRFGFYYIKDLLNEKGVEVKTINEVEDNGKEMMDDFISIVTSFCHRLYGRNRKKKKEKIIEDIKNEK